MRWVKVVLSTGTHATILSPAMPASPARTCSVYRLTQKLNPNLPYGFGIGGVVCYGGTTGLGRGIFFSHGLLFLWEGFFVLFFLSFAFFCHKRARWWPVFLDALVFRGGEVKGWSEVMLQNGAFQICPSLKAGEQFLGDSSISSAFLSSLAEPKHLKE